MNKFFRNVQINLWSIVAELEYQLYPWKTSEPPKWAMERHNVHHNIVDEYEEHMYYGWIKSHDDKISSLQLQMIQVQKELNDLKLDGKKQITS